MVSKGHSQIKKREIPLNKVQEEQAQVQQENNEKQNENCLEMEDNNFSDRIKNYIGSHIYAPQFVKDNMYILSGYRINFNSFKSITKSLFMVHNELVNIWSHFLGAILVIIFIIYLTTSFGNIDFVSVKQKLAENVTNRLEPLIKDLKEFDESLNKKVLENIEIIKQDYNVIENNVVQNFNSLLNELTQLKNEVNQENVDKIVNKIKEFSIQDYYQYADIEKLKEIKQNVLSGINDLKDDLIKQIDSKEFDWIDFHMSDFLHGNEKVDTNQHHVSRWPIFVFLVTAFLCLLCSAAFHLFHAINPQYYKIFLRMDYAGVSLLISGSTFPIFYYGFYCNLELGYFYLACIGIASLVVFFVSLQDFIHTQKYFTMKSVMYGSLGIFAAVPIAHLIYYEFFYLTQNGNFSFSNSLVYYGLMGVCYLGGLTIYATRCPERYKPGQFDICGASHQLWHISILLAIVLTYVGSLINFYTRKMNLCPVSH
ncbi:hypothetical protein ABPG74_013273 [Tetrahymena malaccensis]